MVGFGVTFWHVLTSSKFECMNVPQPEQLRMSTPNLLSNQYFWLRANEVYFGTPYCKSRICMISVELFILCTLLRGVLSVLG